ncbi:DUF1851 domain-containing protein [Pseudomonas putida]|nr:DUF1851 domain-containing protein [Pseudomonas putida]
MFSHFFLQAKKDSNDFEGLFEAPKKKLGTLNHNEMYGFVPALAFGGDAKLERIEKVKTIEHLIIFRRPVRACQGTARHLEGRRNVWVRSCLDAGRARPPRAP